MEYQKTIREQILDDIKEYHEEDKNAYLSDIVSHGCVGGGCSTLVYHNETHAFFNHFAEEIDEILQRYYEEMGDAFHILEVMRRLGQNDLRNFLAWFAYEYEAQRLLDEPVNNAKKI